MVGVSRAFVVSEPDLRSKDAEKAISTGYLHVSLKKFTIFIVKPVPQKAAGRSFNLFLNLDLMCHS